jgi:hypothetical protein
MRSLPLSVMSTPVVPETLFQLDVQKRSSPSTPLPNDNSGVFTKGSRPGGMGTRKIVSPQQAEGVCMKILIFEIFRSSN